MEALASCGSFYGNSLLVLLISKITIMYQEGENLVILPE
jgi:hypothetical protein